MTFRDTHRTDPLDVGYTLRHLIFKRPLRRKFYTAKTRIATVDGPPLQVRPRFEGSFLWKGPRLMAFTYAHIHNTLTYGIWFTQGSDLSHHPGLLKASFIQQLISTVIKDNRSKKN